MLVWLITNDFYIVSAGECGVLPFVENADYDTSLTFPSGFTYKYNCKTGYIIDGDDVNECLGGQWKIPLANIPKCRKSKSHFSRWYSNLL